MTKELYATEEVYNVVKGGIVFSQRKCISVLMGVLAYSSFL